MIAAPARFATPFVMTTPIADNRHRPGPTRACWRVLALLLAVHAGCATAASDAGLDSMAQRMRACEACHGAQGRSTPDGYFPRIAGKPAGYLHQQLLHFRDGRREHAHMAYLLDRQTPTYLRDMAEYFGGLDLPYPPPPPASAGAAVLARGATLAREGDAARDLPACTDCHGERLTGLQPAVPGLLGLPQDYLAAQLGAWRTGTRRAHAPDCMADIARRLDAADIEAVSAWLAAQPLPEDTRAAQGRPRGDLSCGSLTPPPDPPAVDSAPTSHGLDPAEDPVARGAYLAVAANCQGCHTARGGERYAGGRGIPTRYGVFHAPNITADTRTGIGRWDADDFWRALHEGRSIDGAPLYPVFPYTHYTRLTRADSDALFAYLRSLPPVQRENRAHALRFPYDQRWLLAVWRALYFRPGVHVDDPARDARWNRGAYLVEGLGHCSACHAGRNALGAVGDQGGAHVLGWYAPALDDAAEAGLAHWTTADAAALLRDGQARGASMLGPMADVSFDSLQHLSPADLDAMVAYLQALPARAARQPPRRKTDEDWLAASRERGAPLYREHCADCHGGRAQGRPPAAPALVGNRTLTMPAATNPIRVILYGGFAPGTRAHPQPFGMPPYNGLLDDQQIADILNWLRRDTAAVAVHDYEVRRQRSGPLW
jgi:cytochrome c553